MARNPQAKPAKKPALRKKGEGDPKTVCDNIGCIRILKNGFVDVPVDGTPMFYCPEEAEGHPEKVWRVTNSTTGNGFIVAGKTGYTGGKGTPDPDTVQAQKHEYLCAEQGQGHYVPLDEFMDFKIYRYCRDRKCR